VSPPARLGAFALVLALAFGGATLAGSAVGPIDDDPEPSHTVHVDPPTSDSTPGSTAPTTTTSTTHPAGHEGEP